MRRTLLIFTLVLLTSWGCHKKPPVATVPAPAPPAPTEPAPKAVTSERVATLESAPIAKTITSVSNLEVGDLNLKAGNCVKAMDAYEAALNGNPDSRNLDKAWFGLGVCRAVTGDVRQAEIALKRLIFGFPASPYKAQAELILELLSQVNRLRSDLKERDDRLKKLSDELQTLKEIDLQRKPSRPE